jgi:hypothetical protein
MSIISKEEMEKLRAIAERLEENLGLPVSAGLKEKDRPFLAVWLALDRKDIPKDFEGIPIEIRGNLPTTRF